MKAISILCLLLSLALNAALVHVAVSGRSESRTARAVTAPATATPAAAAGTTNVWSEVRSEDPREMMARLKASGFPDPVIRSIVAAQIREPYAARIRALQARVANPAYWKTTPTLDPGDQAQLRQWYRDQQKAVKEVLGDDPADSGNPYESRSFAYLAPDHAAALRKVLREFDERRSDLFSSGFNYAVDRDKMTALEQEQKEAIAGVLSPAELLEYNLRASNTSQLLRQKLLAFKPTEEEFRAIFQLQAAYDERYDHYTPGMSPEEMRQRAEAQKLLTNQIKGVLSPDRAAAYEQLTDYNYVRTSQLVARLELPPQTADNLYALQKEYERQRSDFFRNGHPSMEQTMEKMKTMQAEATARAKTMLGGDRGLEAYKQYGGSWLSYMVPRPHSPVPAAPQQGTLTLRRGGG